MYDPIDPSHIFQQIHFGCERRVIFDFVNVIQQGPDSRNLSLNFLECTLNQALIRDKRIPKLSILAASQTKDKTILTEDGVGRVLEELKESFDYIIW
jgi:septum site-determining protein MinD